MSSYFAKVALCRPSADPALLRSLGLKGDAYMDHALVWRLFPGDGEARDFIFRRHQEGGSSWSYYVVSQRRPQEVPGVLSVQCKPYEPNLQAGEWVRFDLRANPVVAKKQSGAAGSRRHDVLMDAKRQAGPETRAEAMDQAALQWLLGKAPQWGLAPREESILISGYAQHRLQHKGRRIAFSSLDYHGLAQVTDALLLRKALTEGVGHARGFGCGLLLVRRGE